MNTEHDDFEFGDVGRLDLSFQYRVLPWSFRSGEDDAAGEEDEFVPGFLYLVLETSFIGQERDEVADASDPDSGGFTWFITPGLQYVNRRFVLEAAVLVPVVQALHGDALENDFIVTAGFRISL